MAKIKIDIDQLQSYKVNIIVYLSLCKANDKKDYTLGLHGYLMCNEVQKARGSDKPTRFLLTDRGYIDNTIKDKYKDLKIDLPTLYFNRTTTIESSSLLSLITNTINTIKDTIVNKIPKDIEEKYKELEVIYEPYILENLYIYTNSEMLLNTLHEENLESLKDLLNTDEAGVLSYKKCREDLHNISLVHIENILNYENNIGLEISNGLSLYGSRSNIQDKVEIYYRDRIRFWDIKENVHPLLRFKRLFFNNMSDTNNYVSVMEYPKGVEIGARISNACFGVVYCKEQLELLQEAINVYKQQTYPLSVLCCINLPTLLDPCNIRNSWSMGSDRYNINKHGILQTLNGEELIAPIVPAGLANKVFNYMDSLYNILDTYRENKKSKLLTFIDVTDRFFKEDEKGNIYCLIPNGQNDIVIEVQYEDKQLMIPIEFSSNFISRNNLKNLEKEHPKITIVLEKAKDSKIVYYYLIAECDKGIGIYYNFYSSNYMLK